MDIYYTHLYHIHFMNVCLYIKLVTCSIDITLNRKEKHKNQQYDSL